MTLWLTCVRNALMSLAALMLFAGLVTEFVAASLGFDARLGRPELFWYGLPLYDAWDFLGWGFAPSPAQPWNGLLTIGIACLLAVAAFGVFVIASGLAPLEFPSLKFRRGFERWDILRQRGLLGANGLALGAVRRHVLAEPNILSMPRGNIAIIGAPEHTDDSLLATLSTWQGALVLIDARGIASKLARRRIIRFAPGRVDSASYNPLLALRSGVHAWEDAKELAAAFLQTGDRGTVNVFALLVLDQLLAAPIEQRTLAALRKRLADPQQVLMEFCSAWGIIPLMSDQPLSEMARIAHMCSAHPHATLGALARIDAALGLFADGAYANATSAHQFRFADLVAGGEPSTLVIASPPGETERAVSLIVAMLAQLARECAASADLDHLGRRKQRDLLIVIEAEACRALGAARAGAQGAPPLVPAHTSRNGCHALLQTRCVAEAARFAGVDSGSFAAITAIGPQTKASAAALSARGGAVCYWQRVRQYREVWKEWLLPEWEQASRAIVSEGELRIAPSDRVHLFVRRLKPIRALALSVESSAAHFADANTLPQIAHEWTAPPLPRPQAPAAETKSLTTRTKPIGVQMRKALTRKPPPLAPGAKAP